MQFIGDHKTSTNDKNKNKTKANLFDKANLRLKLAKDCAYSASLKVQNLPIGRSKN